MLIYKYILRILLGLMTLIGIHPVFAQKTKEVKPATQRLANAEMRAGNKQYNDAKYADAEVSYKKSMAIVPGDEKNAFNLGNAMMQQKRYKEAYKQFEDLSKNTQDKHLKAQSFHNMGNAQMGLKDYQKAIDSYKNSLRINPDDEETRYNLALAQKFLKENPPQNNPNKQQNKDDQKDQDQKDQDDQKNQDQKDQQEKPKPDEGDKDSKKDQDQPKQDDPKEDESKGKPKPQPGKMSEQQMKQLLEAMNNEERKTQDKVKAQQVKGQPQPKEKDW